MALRAGYIGIKKSWLGLINKLSTAKIIKSIGNGLELTSAGKLNVTAASASAIGGLKVGDGLSVGSGGKVSVSPATAEDIGGVIVGDGLSIDEAGVISANASGFSRTNLYTGSASTAGAVTLTSAIGDNDLLEIVLTDGSVYRSSYLVPAYTLIHLPASFGLSIFDYQMGDYDRTLRLSYTDATHLAIDAITGGIVLAEINKY